MDCAFITTESGSYYNYRLRLKYVLMRLKGVVYPDAFCIPTWMGSRIDFVGMGSRFRRDKYDFIFSELNAHEDQLIYLKEVTEAVPEKMVILPGPREVFEMNGGARGLAKNVLRKAGHVWAYSGEAARFANDYAEDDVARVIPWPFNFNEVRRLGGAPGARVDGEIRVLIGVPIRFAGAAENAAGFLEECLIKSLEKMSRPERMRFRLYGMVYTKADEKAWRMSGFGRRIAVKLERRKSYAGFLRFVGRCDAVIVLPRFPVLGRITFIAAALEKPGIFTENVELNRRLYGRSLVSSCTDAALKELVPELLRDLLNKKPDMRFMPDTAVAQEVGSFEANGAKARQLLYESATPARAKKSGAGEKTSMPSMGAIL